MGKFNTRQGLSSHANSDITGQFSVYGGGASIPLLVDGATNRLLTLSDTNSGSVFYVQDADGTRLFDITTTGIEVGGNYTLPLTDGTASQYLTTDGAGAVTWEDLPTSGITTVDVHNNTGSTLSKGAPVYVTGTHASGKPTVALTDADGSGTYPAIGLISADIANGADGTVTAGGTLANWDTSAFTAGDALYIDTTAGALTATRPTATTAKVQKVAVVTRSHATNGSVHVMGAGRTNDIPNDVSLLDLADTPASYGIANYYLKTDGSGATGWGNPLAALEVDDITNIDTSPTTSFGLLGTVLTRTDGTAAYDYSFDGPRAGFLALRQVGAAVTAGAPLSRTGSGYSNGVGEVGVQLCNNTARCLGIAFSDEDSSRFVAITSGIIPNLDTSAWSSGDILYVSNTTGELTNTVPTLGTYIQRVGYVVSSNATQGIIAVNVDPAFDEDQSSYITDITAEAISDLSDVNTSGAVAGNLLRYDGSNWVDTTLTIPSSATVSAGTTEVLKFTTSNAGTIAELDLGELGDVDLTTTAPVTNDVLKFDGTNWVPGTVSASTAMEDITNASITPADLVPGNFLLYSATGSGGVWYPANYTLPTSDGSDWQVLTARDLGGTYNDAEWQTLTLTRLGDVDTTGVANGDTLVYNSTSGNFEPGTAGGSQTLDEVLTEGNTSTQDAQFGGVTVSQSDNGSSYIALNSIADGTDWPALSITSTSASPADNDYIGNISWFGQNSAAENTNYAKIDVQTRDVTDGTEDAAMNIYLMDNGSLTEALEIRGNVIASRVNLDVAGTVETQNTGLSRAFEAISTDQTGSAWPAVAISRYTSSPADNDSIGTFSFNHTNIGLGLVSYASIEGVATDVTDSTEDGALVMTTYVDGAVEEGLRVTGGTIKVADSYTLPAADGTANQILVTDGSGGVTWEDLTLQDNLFIITGYNFTAGLNIGDPVYIESVTGGIPYFAAVSNGDNPYTPALGLCKATYSTGVTIDVVTHGIISDIDTSSWSVGDILYVDAGGGLTNTKPSSGAIQAVASVMIVHATQGKIFVNVNTDEEEDGGTTVSDIADIGNVTVSSPVTNQVLIWNGVASEWQNNSVPVPTLAEVTASGASTTTTVSFASILQTGAHVNVAASGNSFSQFRAATLEVGTSGTEQYQFPSSDGNAGEVLMTDGSGALSYEKVRSMTFSNSGVHQLTTSTDTFYRLCAATTAPNSTYWTRTTSSTAPSSLTRTAQHSKAGHVIPVDITNAVVNCTVSSSISASASSDTAASEYVGDTITYYMYKWADGSVATQIATWTDTFNGAVSYAEEQSSPTEFTLTANAGDAIFVVARCLTSATATRYWSMQYTIDIQY